MEDWIRNEDITMDNTENIEDIKDIVIKRYKQMGLSLYYVNIRSLNKHFEELEIQIKKLDLPDIVILTETFNISDINNYKIHNYFSYYNYSKLNKNDGVIVYIKSNLKHNVKIIEIDNFKIIKLTIINGDRQININALYRCFEIESIKFIN